MELIISIWRQFEKVRNYTPKEFVEKVLVDILNATEVYCGFNFTFGKEKSGNIDTLEKLLTEKKYKIECTRTNFG